MFEKGFSISVLSVCALAFLTGILFVNRLSQLPSFYLTAFIIFLAICACVWLFRYARCSTISIAILFFLLGISRAYVYAYGYLEHVLPESLAGTDIQVTGTIASIPRQDGEVQRFVFEVQGTEHVPAEAKMPDKIRLSWYYGNPVHAGEVWQFLVRLKPPHGFLNPGGFDYERWLYQQGIHATGYVRESKYNARVEVAPVHSVQRLRENISKSLPGSAFSGMIKALLVGERSGILQAQWDTLITTGTNHLMAISGLHIGLVSLFGYWLSRRLIPAALMLSVPAQHIAICAGVCVALLYAMLAGFAIPTQRAMIMLTCVAGALVLRRTAYPPDILSVALMLVLLWDPMAVLSAGFWFSFLAVAAIFYALSSAHSAVTESRLRSILKQWVWIQIAITLALFPVSLHLFQQASLVSPLANLLLVPYVSFTVVPLVLLGLLTMFVSAPVSGVLFTLASSLFELIWPLLELLAEMPVSRWSQHKPGLLLTALGLLGAVILLSRNIGYKRFAGVLLLMPMLAFTPAQPADGDITVTFLDVGQGLSVVINTGSHVLVYDTGARFSDRMNSGSSTLVPYLRQQGIKQLDLLIVSHGDNDHIGGAESLLAAYPGTPVMGQGIESLETVNKVACRAGDAWHWEGVNFTILHPDASHYKKTNNQSCVLRIEAPGGTVLLTGDIEKNIESRLLKSARQHLDSDILLVPHHGSKSSSTPEFIEATSPKIAIFASGYRNRYGLPSEVILQRYTQLSAKLYATGHHGAIEIKIDAEKGVLEPQLYRQTSRKYWHHQVPVFSLDG